MKVDWIKDYKDADNAWQRKVIKRQTLKAGSKAYVTAIFNTFTVLTNKTDSNSTDIHHQTEMYAKIHGVPKIQLLNDHKYNLPVKEVYYKQAKINDFNDKIWYSGQFNNSAVSGNFGSSILLFPTLKSMNKYDNADEALGDYEDGDPEAKELAKFTDNLKKAKKSALEISSKTKRIVYIKKIKGNYLAKLDHSNKIYYLDSGNEIGPDNTSLEGKTIQSNFDPKEYNKILTPKGSRLFLYKGMKWIGSKNKFYYNGNHWIKNNKILY
ncbi:hypothetical protein DY124_04615 [Apilactobacillus micheneri]|uniref:hypothetical protein n=1 Tax=Apilactobacillus micheneri TaxID=1899430 RepID=UPI00112EC0A2|nr:hypothetical protein [Apilactobacillus micheneri]TPR43883.1 hypothetical protein DY124_04615 [Apilactobacillus micheneri]TPR47655.1 hypothetical protein DY125_04615 [Apilactobacillus micheneri]